MVLNIKVVGMDEVDGSTGAVHVAVNRSVAGCLTKTPVNPIGMEVGSLLPLEITASMHIGIVSPAQSLGT